MALLDKVGHDKAFYLANGTHVHDIFQLVEALEYMDEHIFSAHVKEEKHDFAQWVADVFKDETLAQKLRNTKSKEETELLLLRTLLKELKMR